MSVIIEDKFNVSAALCLTWETERPGNYVQRSPVFAFQNCKFVLELVVNGDSYILTMCLTSVNNNVAAFKVKTYFLDPQRKEEPLFYQRTKLTSLPFLQYYGQRIAFVSISEMEKFMPSFKTRGILRIECLFYKVDSSTQSVKSEEQQSIHFPLKTESPINHNFSLESLSKDLEALLDNKTLPDVQLTVGETSIPCHRAVLTARSRVFAAMFQHKMTESTSGVLEIKDMDLSTTEVFLKYLYSGIIPDDLTEDMLLKLFEISDKYEVNALKRVCSNEMMKSINEKNYLSYLNLAEDHSDQEFKDAVVRFVIKDEKLLKSEEWINFSSGNHKLATEVYRKYFEK